MQKNKAVNGPLCRFATNLNKDTLQFNVQCMLLGFGLHVCKTCAQLEPIRDRLQQLQVEVSGHQSLPFRKTVMKEGLIELSKTQPAVRTSIPSADYPIE